MKYLCYSSYRIIIMLIFILLSFFSCANISDSIENITSKFTDNFKIDSKDPNVTYTDGVSIENGTLRITQYGITWHIKRADSSKYAEGDSDYGQFANGDYWVVGPVNIVSISPKSTNNSGRVMNGSMINPSVITGTHGYDSSCFAGIFDETLNVALSVSTSKPLKLEKESSLISTISISTPQNRPQLQTAAVLTVLSSIPATGSFRPPYCGNDKSVRFNISQLNYGLLSNLTPVAGTPLLSDIERKFQRVWLDHMPGWGCRPIHPADNMPDYGEDMSRDISDGALMLNLNFTNSQKETLLIRLIQLGIDNFGIIQSGGRENWAPDGGHCSGRKWPILFAGLILNDADMKNIGQKSGNYLYTYNYPAYGPGNVPPDYIHFQEDGTTFYVSAADVALASTVTVHDGITFYGHFYPNDNTELPEYTPADIGMPEYGIRHSTNPLTDGNAWDVTYRNANGATWAGFILAARIMESTASARTLWNHPAIFEYVDRHMAVTATSSVGTPPWRYNTYSSYTGNTQFIQDIWNTEAAYRSGNVFQANMWDTYRHQY